MVRVNIYEAKTQLSRLVKRARAGEEVIIADAGTPVARLVPLEPPRQPRVLGADRGTIWFADDAFAPMTPGELAEWEAGSLFPAERPGESRPASDKPIPSRAPRRRSARGGSKR